ncbi:MAG: HD domain-containing protein [archaeon]
MTLTVNNREELYRLLPEVMKIKDPKIQEEIERYLIEEVPDYFWNRESSSSGKYHSKDETGKYGLLLHTKRVFTALERLMKSWKDMGKINKNEKDLARAAVLLHDTFKFGVSTDFEGNVIPGRHTVSDHDRIASEQFLQKTQILGTTKTKIAKGIAAHNGPWGCSQNPETNFQLLIHLCDMFAADKKAELAVYKPFEGLKEIGVTSWRDQ